jgi:hypothetical protein
MMYRSTFPQLQRLFQLELSPSSSSSSSLVRKLLRDPFRSSFSSLKDLSDTILQSFQSIRELSSIRERIVPLLSTSLDACVQLVTTPVCPIPMSLQILQVSLSSLHIKTIVALFPLLFLIALYMHFSTLFCWTFSSQVACSCHCCLNRLQPYLHRHLPPHSCLPTFRWRPYCL